LLSLGRRKTFSLERKQMKRMSRLLCAAAIMLMSGITVSYVYAQSTGGRALFSYPMRGQTPEQQEADRAACHEWAVAQTGHDPSLVFAAQRAVPIEQSPMSRGEQLHDVCRSVNEPGMQRTRLNELYYAYLRAGAVCLEARGYQVSR
jgi:hypothetical protein